MGKRSAEADLGEHRGAIRHLLATADVVLLGYRPRSLDRFGLAIERLREEIPNAIVASLSAWGEEGPWAERPGFDSIVQAASGIAVEYGSHRDGEWKPGALPVQALDHSSAYIIAAGVMDLLATEQSGIVRVSLLGAARSLLDMDRVPSGVVETPEPILEQIPSPYGDLLSTPPPLTLNGKTISRPIRAYGRDNLSWLEREDCAASG